MEQHRHMDPLTVAFTIAQCSDPARLLLRLVEVDSYYLAALSTYSALRTDPRPAHAYTLCWRHAFQHIVGMPTGSPAKHTPEAMVEKMLCELARRSDVTVESVIEHPLASEAMAWCEKCRALTKPQRFPRML